MSSWLAKETSILTGGKNGTRNSAVADWCAYSDHYFAGYVLALIGTGRFLSRNLELRAALSISRVPRHSFNMEIIMNQVIYLVGLVVVVMAVLSFIGIH